MSLTDDIESWVLTAKTPPAFDWRGSLLWIETGLLYVAHADWIVVVEAAGEEALGVVVIG